MFAPVFAELTSEGLIRQWSAARHDPQSPPADAIGLNPTLANQLCLVISGHLETPLDGDLVPLAGVEPALLAELDFEFERVYQFRHRGADRRGAGARRGY